MSRDDVSQDTKDALEMMNYKDIPIQGVLRGFTPVMDALAQQYGLIGAAVFGKVWRYCQMSDGLCRASMQTIAAGLGIDRTTAHKHVDALVLDGYLIDMTPDRRNAPHVYKDAKKVKIGFAVTVDDITPTVAHITPTVDKTDMKKESKTDSKKENLYPLAQALAEACKVDISANKGRLLREAKTLSRATPPATPELIKEHYNGNPSAFWKARDWRGQKGQYPTLSAIRETWGQWTLPNAKNLRNTSQKNTDGNGISAEQRARAEALAGD